MKAAITELSALSTVGDGPSDFYDSTPNFQSLYKATREKFLAGANMITLLSCAHSNQK